MRITPLRGLRPAPEWAGRIPSPPYDVLDDAEARAIARDEPSSFVRVIRAEVDLPEGTDPHGAEVYDRARANLRAMIADGRMVHDPKPALYVYRLASDGHAQDGLVAASSVEDYEAGRIRVHELTRPEKEDDRVRHAATVRAHCGPVLLTYPDDAVIDELVAALTRSPPEVAFRAGDGVEHALWRVDRQSDVAALVRAFERLPATYIADGHHRAASAARVARELREREGSGPWDGFLSVLFPAGRMRVLEYNRLVRDTAGLDPDALRDRIRATGFDVRVDPDAGRPGVVGTFGMIASDGVWRLLVPRPVEGPSDAVAALDVSVLTDRILRPVLGIDDPRTDRRIDFLGGIHGPEGVERRVARGDYAVGFTLHPTRIADVLRVADAGGVMPPKSTWFEPKARSGMVVLDFEAP